MISNKLLMPLVFISGFLIRLLLLKSPSLSKILEDRVEISTPLSSWKRVIEGITLEDKNINPYYGDIYHESQIMLTIVRYVLKFKEVELAFSLCDVLTAFMLAIAAYVYLQSLVDTEENVEAYPESARSLLLQPSKVQMIPFYVACVYLFCPYAIASCCGKSTVTFFNLIVALFTLFTSAGYFFLASAILGVITFHSIYHICLLAPLILCVVKTKGERSEAQCILTTSTTFLVMSKVLFMLFAFSFNKTGSWAFIDSTYGFALSVPDLTPNIGVFWYFFTEMFDHFRTFFLWTFQLNAFIYTIPLAIRFRHEPMLLLFVHLLLIPLFKSYPCIGDVALYLALLPAFKHLFVFMRQSFFVGCVFVSCSLLAPTLWHLWIYSGSANANFYFSITLVFNTGQIFLLTDILSAYIKREYYLKKGIERDPSGNPVILHLE